MGRGSLLLVKILRFAKDQVAMEKFSDSESMANRAVVR